MNSLTTTQMLWFVGLLLLLNFILLVVLFVFYKLGWPQKYTKQGWIFIAIWMIIGIVVFVYSRM